jgi:6-phosphogluconate dehydrogenase
MSWRCASGCDATLACLMRRPPLANFFRWGIDLGGLARIWRGGCIIRAVFLGDIAAAYERDPALPNLLVDPDFAKKLAASQASWRRVVSAAVAAGVATPGISSSLGYFDSYRCARQRHGAWLWPVTLNQ